MFQYKTRGDSSPQGKQRVYFTCHPKDFDTCFERLSDSVLKHQNCAVWYSYPEEEYSDIDTDLGQMNLFVIPVTTKLLTTPNRTMDIDLPFALKRHIPILPLMQENGLDELYAEKFCDLQYLNENTRDNTELPYEEKLIKYLNSVLVGDELTAKVRAAFDAYIFLSYRKKDRKYAQELMRLIHKNDFCRDIAIWYDEFLTPGENFNDAIGDALKKSELFALVVTPNLVNEINYVKTVEYPMALEQEKKVLPAEFVETEKDKLSEWYKAIPEAIDINDGEKLSKSLLDALCNIAKIENDTEPQHNFFIGLAYLYGIDVEHDNDRAVSLITSAAKAELIEAAEKLVGMYRSGDGVERDYLKAIEWQRTLVEICRKKYSKSGSQTDGDALLSNLWGLGDYLYDVRKLADAENTYTEMEETVLELNAKFDGKFLRDLSVSYERLGDIRKANGDLTGAEEYYKKSLEIREKLANETGTVEALHDLSVSCERLGIIRQANGDLSSAEEYYKKSFEIREKLANETGTVEALRGLSISYNNLGDIRQANGDLPGEEYYKKSFEIFEKLANETGTVEALHDLSLSYDRLGRIRQANGELSGAEEYYKKSLEIFKKLANETGTVEALRNLSVSYGNLGGIREVNGDLTGAEEYYKTSLEIREKLANETDTVEALRDLSGIYNRLGNIRRVNGDLVGAEEYFKKSLEIKSREKLAIKTGTAEELRNLSVSYDIRGGIRQANGDLTGAEEYYKKSLETREKLANETGTVEALRGLSASYDRLGNIRQVSFDFTGAEEYYKTSLEIKGKLASETGTVEALQDLSVNYNKLGDIRKVNSDLTGAEEYYKKSLEIKEKLTNETCTVEVLHGLSVSYERLGDIRKANGDLTGAEEYYKKSFEIDEKLVNDTGTVEALHDFSLCSLSTNYRKLGDIRKANGDLTGAEEYYKKSLEIREKLANETGTVEALRSLSINCRKLGDIQKAEGNLTDAEEYYIKSFIIMESL